jgi:hypothetical protein
VARPCGRRGGGIGEVSSAPIPLAARMSAGRTLLVASTAIAIAFAAAIAVACGGTTSNTKRSLEPLVTPIVWAFIVRNQPTCTRRPSTTTRRGALSQASRLSATRVTTPSEDSRPAMRSGSSAPGSRERGHHPPSRLPRRVSVGSRRSRPTGGVDRHIVVAGLVERAAEPVARGRARPGPDAGSCRPAGAVLFIGVGYWAEARRAGSWTRLIACCRCAHCRFGSSARRNRSRRRAGRHRTEW